MNEQPTPSFIRRFLLAFAAFFAVLFDRRFAARVLQLRAAGPAELPPPGAATPPAVGPPVAAAGPAPRQPEAAPARPPRRSEPPPAPDHGPALHLLAILQREGRLIDFLQEEITLFSDADVGAAARAVHEGCKRALGECFAIAAIYTEPEGATVVLPPGFDPSRVRLTGNVVGEPPFRGSLQHHGWRATEVKLPSRPAGADPAILAPAEVELP